MVKNGVSETTATTGGAGVGQTITLTGQEAAWNPTFAQAYGGAQTDIPVVVIVGDDWQTCRCDFNGTTGLTVQSIQATYKSGVYDDSAPTGVTLTGTPVAQVAMNAASLIDGADPFITVTDTNPTVNFALGRRFVVNNATIGNITLAVAFPGSYILEIQNSGTLTGFLPASPEWDSGIVPTWAGTSLLALVYDGATWTGAAVVNKS